MAAAPAPAPADSFASVVAETQPSSQGDESPRDKQPAHHVADAGATRGVRSTAITAQAGRSPSESKRLTGSKKSLAISVSVFASYLLLSLVMTWPTVAMLGTAAPGVGEDTPLFLWNIWWIQQFFTGKAGSLLWTGLLFAPDGTSLALHGLTLAPSVLVLPISVAWSPIAALGVLALLNATLNGYTSFRLIRYVTRSGVGAWIGGVIVAYSPWTVGELQNHYNLSSLWTVVLLITALLRLIERPTKWRAVVFGLLLALVTYTDLQFLVLAVPVSMAALAVRLTEGCAGVRRQRAGWRPPRAVTPGPAQTLPPPSRGGWRVAAGVLRGLIGGTVVGVILAAPLLVPVGQQLLSGDSSSFEFAVGSQLYYGGDPFTFVAPDPLRAGGAPSPNVGEGSATPGTASQFTQLGYAAVVLALVGMLSLRGAQPSATRSATRMWYMALAAGLLLVLGPVLKVGGHMVTLGGVPVLNPLGLAAAAAPVLNIERVPTRHMLTVTLAMAVFAAYGVAFLYRRAPSWKTRMLVLAVITTTLVGELWPPPLPMESVNQDPYYSTLSKSTGGTVLDIPFGRGDGTAMSGIYRSALLAEEAQTQHGHPIVSGYVSRGEPAADDSIRQDSFFHYLSSCGQEAPSAEVARQALAKTNTQWVIVHNDWPATSPTGACTPPLGEVESYLEQLGLQREYADEKLVVYSRDR